MKKTFILSSSDKLRPLMLEVWNHVVASTEEITQTKGIKITVQPESLRNLSSNACMWAALKDVSDQVIWYGRKLTPKQYKILLTAGLRKQDIIPNIDGDGFVMIGESTSEMTQKEIGELIEFIFAFGATRDVKFSAPKDSY